MRHGQWLLTGTWITNTPSFSNNLLNHLWIYKCMHWNTSFIPIVFAMSTILLQVVTVSAISLALWKLLGRFFVKSALDNIPGPPSRSFLFGNSLESLIFESVYLLYIQVFFQKFLTPKDGNFTKILPKNVWISFNLILRTRMLTPRRW